MSDEIGQSKKRLLDEARDVLRVQHYSIRTERTYLDWIRRYVRHHGFKNREELGEHPSIRGQPLKNNY